MRQLSSFKICQKTFKAHRYHCLPLPFTAKLHSFTIKNMFKMSFRLFKMKIGTHSGHFHADEALACFLLKQLPEFASAEIVRSRDNKILDTCDIVVDVGARFEPENKRFDHHQREFSETMKTLKVLNFETKLSSAGLIYAYYGKALLSQMTGLAQDNPKLELIFEKVRRLVRPV